MPRQIAVRELDGWHDPEAVFLGLAAGAQVAVWLDGGADATSGRSVIALAHEASRVVVAEADADADVILEELAAALKAESAALTTPVSAFASAPAVRSSSGTSERGADTPSATNDRRGLPAGVRHSGGGGTERTALGWIGWFGYEFGARRLDVPVFEPDAPEAAWLFVDRAIVFDHAMRKVRLEWLGSEDGDAWAARTAAVLGADGRASAGGASARETTAAATSDDATSRGETSVGEASAQTTAPAPRWRHDATAYAAMIAACQDAIARGDAYQLCLTNRVDVDVRPDPLETYLRLRRSSPTHHGGYLRFGDVALLSASPEQFLLVERDGRVSTRPMKGTRPRGATSAEDAALRRELAESEKERAENLMIVDLMRNDLSRVAELGSVHVPDLLVTETYPHVHQLVSTVAARLKPGLTAVDAVAAAFPAGSMTGAPKVSAMRILHELEQGPRGVYSGVFGSLAVDGSADLAMVIRSIVLTPRGASVGTGGGITALSHAGDEIEETRVKARALLAILTGGERTGDPATGEPPAPIQ